MELFDGFSNIYADKKQRLRRVNGELAVHCKDFEVKYLYPNGEGKDLNGNVVESFLSDLPANKKMKIITLLTPILNIYYLCVLATVLRLLELFKNGKENIFEQLEFEILFVEMLCDSEEIPHLAYPFIKHTERITAFNNKLQTGINILLPFDESFVNIMLKRMGILNSKMADKILKNMNYLYLNEYVKEIPMEEKWEQHLEEIEKNENYVLSDGEILNERARSVLFKTNMMHNVLRIFKSRRLIKNNSKIILILGEPVTRVISDFISNELITINNNDMMIIYYSDPVHPDDPPEILKNIPSYITMISSYYNKAVISYGIDERYHGQILKLVGGDKISMSDLEEIIRKDRESYEKNKRFFIDRFLETNGTEHVGEVRKINKKQEEILKIEGDMFLQVQNATLEQLKLLL